jgi:hypothetical protein
MMMILCKNKTKKELCCLNVCVFLMVSITVFKQSLLSFFLLSSGLFNEIKTVSELTEVTTEYSNNEVILVIILICDYLYLN